MFINEQLQSLEAQTVAHLDLWVSDDGSEDNTLAELKVFKKNWSKGKFEILNHKRVTSKIAFTPASGSNENFRSLILNQDIKGDYFAFCDQDDVWDADKLERAGEWLSHQPEDQPCLHCTRTRIIDSAGKLTGKSPLFSKPPSFANAMVQNIAAGNTIVLNKKAMELIRHSASNTDFVSHDWWCYIIVTAYKGLVKYDEKPSLSYRQHGNNLVGENATWKARMTRLNLVLQGRFKNWNDRNRAALHALEDTLPKETVSFLKSFDEFRATSGLIAAIKLSKLKAYRQTNLGQISLYFAGLIGKI